MFKIWWSFFWRWSLWVFMGGILTAIIVAIVRYNTEIKIAWPSAVIFSYLLVFYLSFWAYYRIFQWVMGRWIGSLQFSLIDNTPDSQIVGCDLVEKVGDKFFFRLSWALLWRQILWRILGMTVVCVIFGAYIYALPVFGGVEAKVNLQKPPQSAIFALLAMVMVMDVWAFMMAFRQVLKRKIGELQLTLFKTDDHSAVY